jgi:predicted nucleic acid-binding Zn ribbon protein
MSADEYEEDYDDETTDECPYCGRGIYDDAVQCPHCGNYVSKEDAPRQRMPLWIIIGIVLAFLAVLMML